MAPNHVVWRPAAEKVGKAVVGGSKVFTTMVNAYAERGDVDSALVWCLDGAVGQMPWTCILRAWSREGQDRQRNQTLLGPKG